jgi:uncharacterized membrane protein YbhN (UPF0104 family)
MQVSEPFVKKITQSTFFSIGIKITVFVISSILVVSILLKKEQLASSILDAFLTSEGLLLFFIMLVGMFLNLSVEAFKWQRLLSSTTQISFSTALMAVFSGIAAGLITPHGIGDYIGRVLFIDTTKRMESIGSVLFSRIVQLCVTCMMGIGAVVYYYFLINTDNRLWIAFAIAGLTLLLIYLAWGYRVEWLDKMKRLPLLKLIEKWFDALRHYSNLLFLETLCLSWVRYTIFLTQFVVMLLFFKVDLPLEILYIGGIFTFFVKSIIPTYLDLGVRELAAVFFFSNYQSAEEQVILASLSLWLFNLVIPSFIGLFCMFKIEYTKAK